MKTLDDIYPDLHSKLTGEYIKLYMDTDEQRRESIHKLDEIKFEYFAITPKAERPIKVKLAGNLKSNQEEKLTVKCWASMKENWQKLFKCRASSCETSTRQSVTKTYRKCLNQMHMEEKSFVKEIKTSSKSSQTIDKKQKQKSITNRLSAIVNSPSENMR
ncbi:hypothetical protein TNCV_4783562 [Trichonephila clavipes]|nr:hypothetical protein TNCV_4783562 [Trichonephila clavipes]